MKNELPDPNVSNKLGEPAVKAGSSENLPDNFNDILANLKFQKKREI